MCQSPPVPRGPQVSTVADAFLGASPWRVFVRCRCDAGVRKVLQSMEVQVGGLPTKTCVDLT